jgi:hypothetical protein
MQRSAADWKSTPESLQFLAGVTTWYLAPLLTQEIGK